MLPKSRRNALRCPTLEQLEVRLCLSVDPIFSEGVLTVNGSRDNDSIVISDNGQGVVTVQEGTNAKQIWDFRGVERIVVDAGEGDDSIRFTRGGGAQLPIPELDIQAGNGNDEVFIGLLLPAVQKVREAAARVNVDLGEGNDRLQANTTGVDQLDFDLTAGGGDDEILIGMLLPAIQKVREASARMHFDLGAGNDTLKANTSGIENLDLELTAGGGDDEILIGMLLPAVQKVRDSAARMNVDLGDGHDQLATNTSGVDQLDLDIAAGGGDDAVLIGMLLPAVQKVREAAARMNVDLGDGHDQLTTNTSGVDQLDLDIAAGGGDDAVLIGMLLPAVQKVREAAARMNVDLGDGNDLLKTNSTNIDQLDLDFTAGGGDDEILIGMLLPAIQKVREAAARVKVDLGAGDDTLDIDATGFSKLDMISDAGAGNDHIRHRLFAIVDRTQLNVQTSMGLGNDSLTLDTRGYREIKTDIDTGLAGDGVDQIDAVHISPTARNGSTRRPIVTLLDDGQDTSKLLAVGYETVDVSTEQTRQVTVIQDL